MFPPFQVSSTFFVLLPTCDGGSYLISWKFLSDNIFNLFHYGRINMGGGHIVSPKFYNLFFEAELICNLVDAIETTVYGSQ